jgi:hypothetical protein
MHKLTNTKGMHPTHIIHAYIALHKTDLSDYIEFIGSEMIRSDEIQRRQHRRRDIVKAATVSRPDANPERPGGRKVADRIRSGALLLPAPLRYDWQHSSSQLPIIPNDARRISSPGGRYCFPLLDAILR